MNVLDLLKEDHQEALGLIEELENMADETSDEEDEATLEATPSETFTQLKSALVLHTQIEEQIFYPAMREFDETREMIPEAIEEHQQVDQLLDEMTPLSPGARAFQGLLEELRDNLEEHIDLEENELFPKAEELCSKQQLVEMGRRMQEMKQGRGAAASRKRS